MDEVVYSEIMETLAIMAISPEVKSEEIIDLNIPTRSLRNRSISESCLHKTRNRKVRKKIPDNYFKTNFQFLF